MTASQCSESINLTKARFFLSVDLQEFLSDLGSGGGDEKSK